MNWSGCANKAERPLVLKRPLCTSAESNLGDRVLGEVEKNSVFALVGKEWALTPQKVCVSI